MKRMISAMLVAATVAVGAASADAGPCSEGISKLENTVREAGGKPQFGPTGRQTVGAQLSHQPTPESVEHAQERARARFDELLAQAKSLDAEGSSACLRPLEEARLMYVGP